MPGCFAASKALCSALCPTRLCKLWDSLLRPLCLHRNWSQEAWPVQGSTKISTRHDFGWSKKLCSLFSNRSGLLIKQRGKKKKKEKEKSITENKARPRGISQKERNGCVSQFWCFRHTGKIFSQLVYCLVPCRYIIFDIYSSFYTLWPRIYFRSLMKNKPIQRTGK